MEYIYDIVLNFHKQYYEFYEWKTTDKIINIKKIPIYKVTTKDYLNLKNEDTTIDRSSLPKSNKMFLVASDVEVLGLLLDPSGNVIKKSSLIFEELDDILEDKASFRQIKIEYKINKHNQVSFLSRASKEKRSYIENYLNSLDLSIDEYILKYLYYDIYNEEEENVKIIYNKLLDLSINDLNRIYESVRRVNLELKKS